MMGCLCCKCFAVISRMCRASCWWLCCLVYTWPTTSATQSICSMWTWKETCNTACFANPWPQTSLTQVMIGTHLVLQAVAAQQLPCKDQQWTTLQGGWATYWWGAWQEGLEPLLAVMQLIHCGMTFSRTTTLIDAQQLSWWRWTWAQ